MMPPKNYTSENIKPLFDNNIQVCLVSKGKSIDAIKKATKDFPKIKIIAENRWPDCEKKFKLFKNFEKHFIGHLQSNKVSKVVPLVDMIQSVDSMKLLKKIDRTSAENNKIMKFCFQVNISNDPKKEGLSPNELDDILQEYLNKDLKNVELCGLMTMIMNADLKEREKDYANFKKKFDSINLKYFSSSKLPILSMGTSDDFEIAVKQGATMVRLGSIMFK